MYAVFARATGAAPDRCRPARAAVADPVRRGEVNTASQFCARFMAADAPAGRGARAQEIVESVVIGLSNMTPGAEAMRKRHGGCRPAGGLFCAVVSHWDCGGEWHIPLNVRIASRGVRVRRRILHTM